jgi:photosystem II stability/assembly factor-like uncharacterized protein
MYHTENGGSAWTEFPLDNALQESIHANRSIIGLSFADTKNGWALANKVGVKSDNEMELLRTADGGEKWTVVLAKFTQ